jgi:hypothetical protein
MRTSNVIATACLSAASALVALPAHADYVQQSANPPPPAPSQKAEATIPRATFPHEGLEASGAIGSGFQSTYAFGIEARVGYTFPVNVYVGGNAQYYFGNSVNGSNAYAFFVGPEIGYKLYLIDQLELRPFVFVGGGFNRQVTGNPFTTNTHNTIAVQPGVLAVYHIGDTFFVGADGHFMVTPSPAGFALLATGGANF